MSVGDPVGISGADTIVRADSSVPILAIGLCVSKPAARRCMVRRVGLVPRSGLLPGRIYYLGSSPGAITAVDPNTDLAAKIWQILAVAKNSGTLDAAVTLESTRLR